MNRLTDKHLDMLWEMADLHFKCFEEFYPEYGLTYQSILELNHQKMISIINSCDTATEEMLDFIFMAIIDDYKRMLNRDF